MEKSTSPSRPLLRQPNLTGTSKRVGAIGAFTAHALLLAIVLYGISYVHTPPPQAEAYVPIQLSISVVEEQAAAPPEPETAPVQAPPPEPVPEPEPLPEKTVTKPEPVREQALKARARPKPPRQKPKKEEPVQAVKPEPDERKRLEDERRASQQAAREAKQSLVSILVAQMNRYKRYPSSARKLGLEGVVPVHVTIDGQGRITSISLAGGDVHPALQKAAAETMAKVRGNWKPPAVTQGISVTVPMRFSLRDG